MSLSKIERLVAFYELLHFFFVEVAFFYLLCFEEGQGPKKPRVLKRIWQIH